MKSRRVSNENVKISCNLGYCVIELSQFRKEGGKNMEEKILEKLEKMDSKIDRIETRIDEMETKFDELRVEIKEEIAGLEEKLRTEFKQEIARLEEKLRIEFKQEVANLQENVTRKIKEEVLDYMFVFESDYGRKINIMYEELMARNEKTEALEKSMIALERRVDKNSAFIFRYENQNATLEKTKNND